MINLPLIFLHFKVRRYRGQPPQLGLLLTWSDTEEVRSQCKANTCHQVFRLTDVLNVFKTRAITEGEGRVCLEV